MIDHCRLSPHRSIAAAVRAAAAMALIGVAAAAPASYEVTLLGTLGGGTSSAYGINEAGQVVGVSQTAAGRVHAFLWSEGVMQDLGTLGGPNSWANAINNAGQIVGAAWTGAGASHAFLWQAGVMTDLGTLGGAESEAFDINDAGQIAGWSDISLEDLRAFLWENGTMTDLGVLFDCCSQAFAINAAGQVGGWGPTATGWFQGFIWDAGVMWELETLGGLESWVNGMNDAGNLVGLADTAEGDSHACMWTPNDLLDLGTLGGWFSEAYAVNELDQVVGWSGIDEANEVQRAFLWDGGAMIDLNTRIDAPAAGQLVLASDINDAGQIVGICSAGAFLLTPLPVIESFTVDASGRVALAWSGLGPGWSYTVESRSALDGGDWAPVAGQWPIGGTGWDGMPPGDAGQLFYRVVASFQRP